MHVDAAGCWCWWCQCWLDGDGGVDESMRWRNSDNARQQYMHIACVHSSGDSTHTHRHTHARAPATPWPKKQATRVVVFFASYNCAKSTPIFYGLLPADLQYPCAALGTVRDKEIPSYLITCANITLMKLEYVINFSLARRTAELISPHNVMWPPNCTQNWILFDASSSENSAVAVAEIDRWCWRIEAVTDWLTYCVSCGRLSLIKLSANGIDIYERPPVPQAGIFSIIGLTFGLATR